MLRLSYNNHIGGKQDYYAKRITKPPDLGHHAAKN